MLHSIQAPTGPYEQACSSLGLSGHKTCCDLCRGAGPVRVAAGGQGGPRAVCCEGWGLEPARGRGRRDDSELAMAGGWAGAPCPVLTLAGAFTFRMQLTAPGHSTTFLRLQERCARRFVCCLSPARAESPGPSACALQVGVGREMPNRG
jgi:hypothetical protein